MPAEYDVIVVGAGPAGSSCAAFLGRKGIKTLLVDKAAFPRDKTCGDEIRKLLVFVPDYFLCFVGLSRFFVKIIYSSIYLARSVAFQYFLRDYSPREAPFGGLPARPPHAFSQLSVLNQRE